MAKTVKISKEIKEEVNKIIEKFNNKDLKNRDIKYFAEYKGKYLYLKIAEPTVINQVSRLEYTGDFEDWGFAIFKWSSEKYDADEWMFPGSEHLDGTIKGAMKAGIGAYNN